MRKLRVAAAQMGPVAKDESRAEVVQRLLKMMRGAAEMGVDLVCYPELALTTFFPRWCIDSKDEFDLYFERELPGPETRPLFDEAARLKIGFYLGYAELDVSSGEKKRFNTTVIVDKAGRIVGKYRKVHLPGHKDLSTVGGTAKSGHVVNNFERRYFELGDLGFPVWRAMGANLGMCICNDRRWPETFRAMGLRDVEVVMCGYNTSAVSARRIGNRETLLPSHIGMFHNHLSMQAGAYQNSTWVVGIAKCGREEGHDLMGGSCIISPQGEIVALAHTLEDEVIVADCDLDECEIGKGGMFNFDRYRRIEHYRIITEQTGRTSPPAAG
ncbi:MAG: N-carbamoyl-D-amino-acid hydrolase [Proteobacteria bacterium]|nr:N-carbamoyl-D-amino-acid hydrolase [Pseudomonadota bacterium]